MNKKILLLGIVLIVLSSFVSAVGTAPSAVNTVSYWGFDTALIGGDDYTPNAHDDIANTADFTASGKYLGAYDFESTNLDYIQYADSDNFSFTDGAGNDKPFSISMWFKPESDTGSVQSLIGKFSAEYEYDILFNTDEKLQIQLYSQGGSSAYLQKTSNSALSIGTMYYIVITYDGSNSGSGITFYIDSTSEAGVSSDKPTYAGMKNTAYDLYIGARTGATLPSDGIIDEVSIFNKELSQNEVDYLYNTGSPGADQQYPFGQIVGQFELTALNGYNSTLINEFNATFINSTNTTSLETTNGTILYNINEIVNLTVGGGDYFNKTFTNYNTSNNLQANLTQTNITFNFVFNNTLTPITTPINVTDLTTGLEFTATNGTLTIPPNANTNLNFNFSCQLDVFEPRNITFNFNAREIANYTVELEPTLVNLTFKDSSIGLGIENATINVKYPSGSDIDIITNSDGSALFSYVNVDTVEFGDYNFTFEGTDGFISPVSFIREINSTNVPYEEEFNISRANLIINIYDREDNSLFSGKEVEIFMQGVFNETTSTGQLVISNLTVIEDTYTVVAISEGYFTEQKTIDFTNKENLTIDFYMLNITGINTGSHFVTVVNEFFIEQPDTVVELLELDLVTNTAKKVSECLANNNGECFFGVELGIKKYVITGSKTIDGVLNTDTTNPEGVFINIDNDITKLFLKLRDDFVSSAITDLNIAIPNNLQDIRDGLTNTTSINVSFSTDSGSSTIICLDYYTFEGIDKTLDSYQCVNSDSGTIISTKSLNRSNNYNIEVYQVENNLKILYLSENILSVNSFEKIADDEEWLSPLVLVPYVLLLAFAYWARRIMWFWIGTIAISWGLLAWLPSIMLTSVVIMITVVCLFEIKISMKKRAEL